MKLLQEYLSDRLRLTESQFLARHPHPVLIHRLRTAAANLSVETELAPRMSMRAMADSVLSMNMANARALVHLTKVMSRLGGAEASPAESTAVVFDLALRPGSEEVTIGRSGEAMVPLPFPKISKVHARLGRRQGTYCLSDAGSRNGTRVGGTALGPGEWRPLPSETLVQLSEYQFLFCDEQGLYRLLGEG